MQKRLLIAYATRAGSTAEIAEAIGEEMKDESTEVDVLDVTEIRELEPYQAVVIGAPIYMGRVIKEIPRFAKQHRDNLSKVPLAAFVVGTTVIDRTEKSREQARSLMEEALFPLRAREIGVFSGCLNPHKLSVGEKAVLKLVKAEYGDYRDWDEIKAWAEVLRENLQA